MTRDEAAASPETILAGLKQGSLILDSEDRPLILRPLSDSIEAELESSRRATRRRSKLLPGAQQMQPLTHLVAQADSPAEDAAKMS